FATAVPAGAQSSKKLIANGNKLYEEGRYKDAAAQYGRALQKDTTYAGKSSYNLGNALYQQKQVEPARKAYEAAAKKTADRKENSEANYNIGNTYMAEKKWEEAIEAYKKTLRNNPQDADAKYNLSYARQMLKKEGGGGKDKNKDQDKKDQDQKEQQQKQDQQKQDEQKKDEQKDQQPKEGEQEKQEEQKPQPQPSKLSEKQAEQLLNALQQEEKKLQEKNKKKYGTPVKAEKDW
ncbi:MAG: tetratricopeptide repeat protein, partial [Chitinophagaceae bacterium]|nr:tetratricopeptide repeat protein [Chitinophagaceae bacterium]